MSNVLVIKASRELPEMRAEMRTATLFGGAAVFGAIASLFEGIPAAPAGGHLGTAALIIVAIGVTMASNNLLVQYGLARAGEPCVDHHAVRDRDHRAVGLFASELPSAREWAGGACIVLATLLSSRVHRAAPAPDKPGDGRDGARAMV